MKLIYSLLILIFIFSPLYAENYGSISGKVTGEKSGEGIPGVVVEVVTINSVIDIKTKTDSEGRYSFDKLTPDTYYLNFFLGHPYCVKNEWDIHKVRIEAGKKVVLNKTLELGGAISGKVYKKDGKTPFEGIFVIVVANDDSVKRTRTKADGSYYFDGLCPSLIYYINVSFGDSPYKALTGISVVKEKEIKLKDIVFNLNDVTGIEGYVKSSCDGGDLENAIILAINVEYLTNYNFSIGRVIKTDKEGWYYMNNLEPGFYLVTAFPPFPPGKDEVTGKPFFRTNELSRYISHGYAIVKKGSMKRQYWKLNIPSYSKTMKTQVDVRLKYGKYVDKKPYSIVLKGSREGTALYRQRKVIEGQLDYRFVGISPGRYWFGVSFLEQTNSKEKEEIYYPYLTQLWLEAENEIHVPWDYKVTIEVFISSTNIDKKREKSKKLSVTTRVDMVEVHKNKKERMFSYKIEVTRELNKIK